MKAGCFRSGLSSEFFYRFHWALQVLVVGACVIYLFEWSHYMAGLMMTGDIWVNDFFAFWSFAKFTATRPVFEIYDDSILGNLQMDLGARPKNPSVYVYPPFFLLFIMPLGFLSYHLAYAVWLVSTFAAYAFASLYKQASRWAALLVVFAPASVITFAFGQTGFLSAAMIVGGFRLTATRPYLSGALLGLASFKPQLGILVPVALISARLWRTAAAPGATVVALVVASGAAFGWSTWLLWLEKIGVHAGRVLDTTSRYNPTITANLTSFGIDLMAARIVQVVAAVVVIVIIWICFRRGVTILTSAALFVGTFLATPYAFVYDLPLVTNAVLAVIFYRARTQQRLRLSESLIMASSLLLPIVMTETWRLSMLRSIPLILLLGLIVRHVFDPDVLRPGTAAAEETAPAR